MTMPSARDAMPDRQPIRTAADVRHLLATEIERLAANPDLDPIGKARVLAQLAGVALRAMERETLEARVEAIETALKVRKKAQPKETLR
jgi:hypothetical protein